jgi:hypothetical protein
MLAMTYHNDRLRAAPNRALRQPHAHKRREGVRNGHVVSARPSPRKVDQKTNIGQVEKRDGQPPRQRRNRNRFAQDPVYAGDDVPQWMHPTRKVKINLV